MHAGRGRVYTQRRHATLRGRRVPIGRRGGPWRGAAWGAGRARGVFCMKKYGARTSASRPAYMRRRQCGRRVPHGAKNIYCILQNRTITYSRADGCIIAAGQSRPPSQLAYRGLVSRARSESGVQSNLHHKVSEIERWAQLTYRRRPHPLASPSG